MNATPSVVTAPAILVVTGASGAGKSTLVRRLAALGLPGVGCYEFDTIGIPSAAEIVARFGDGEGFQAWALDTWVGRLARNDDRVAAAVLDASVRPRAALDALARHGIARGAVVLVDCDYAERNARLRGPRGQPELATAQMDGWAAYLRGQADALDVPVVDTTGARPEASLVALRAHVDALNSSISQTKAMGMTTGLGQVDHGGELARIPWAQRRFAFVHPPWMLADFVERLRGLMPRLDVLLKGVGDEAAHVQVDGKWSIAQNVGHLSDVEELWQERLEDLRQSRPVYTAALPARFQGAAARHQSRSLRDTVVELGTRRARLVEALATAPATLQTASAFHERLQTPMRLVDCAQFYAEHDDHHLLRIRALRPLVGVVTG